MIHLLFTVDMLRPLYVFSILLDFIDLVRFIYQTFSSLSGVRIVLNIAAVRYSLHKCSKTKLC